jgi:hypothetical protein
VVAKDHREFIWRMNINAIEGKEKYCGEVVNGFAAFEDLDAEVEINSA